METDGRSSGSPSAAENPRPRGRLVYGLIIGGCLAAAVLIYSFYRQQLTWIRQEQGRTLLNIADIKAKSTSSWLRERIADGYGVPSSPAFASFLGDFLAGRAGPAAGPRIRKYFELLRTNHEYSAVLLFDAQGKLSLSDPERGGQEQSASAIVQDALKQRRVLFEDFYRPGGGPVRLAVIGPIDAGGPAPVGAIGLLVDPARFLYPHIQTWPLPTETGETLLVRREQGDVVYLNELRHRSNTALTFRVPLNSADLPTSNAVMGYEGLVEGTDYRGVLVLAAVRHVPDSPWFLVTKIDRTEAFAGLYARTGFFAVVTLLVLVAGSAVVMLAWSRRESEYYRQTMDQRRQTEQDLKVLNSELERRVKDRTAMLEAANKELESFSYSVSHDLRAPLRGISGWTQALIEDFGSKDGGLDGRANEYLERICSETQRMNLLIGDLLELSRISRVEMRRVPVDLSSVANMVVARCRDSAGDRQIEFLIEPALTTSGDPRLLEIALTNLIGNAVKFTRKRTDAIIEVGRSNQDGEQVFYVRDNGIGFNMQYASKLFGAFQRMHRASDFPGTGIGLAIVQRIVRRHGGSVWADAAPNAGATFYFTLEEKRVLDNPSSD